MTKKLGCLTAAKIFSPAVGLSFWLDVLAASPLVPPGELAAAAEAVVLELVELVLPLAGTGSFTVVLLVTLLVPAVAAGAAVAVGLGDAETVVLATVTALLDLGAASM